MRRGFGAEGPGRTSRRLRAGGSLSRSEGGGMGWGWGWGERCLALRGGIWGFTER